MDIDDQISRHIRELRKSCGLTLDRLAERSGVSRSMISLIERQETSPTAAVLNRLAGALGVTLSSLFDAQPGQVSGSPMARAADQPTWTDPASGYLRRQVSPTGQGRPIDLIEVVFPAGETVLFENAHHLAETHQVVWLLAGEMDIALGGQSWHLDAGDCLAMQSGSHIAFHNPGRQPARYVLALTSASTQQPRRAT